MVQIEAMMNGVPCVASNLPGVRQPVLTHHMGRVIPIGDSKALAEAVLEILADKNQTVVPEKELKEFYSPDSIAAEYEALFEKITEEIHRK